MSSRRLLGLGMGVSSSPKDSSFWGPSHLFFCIGGSLRQKPAAGKLPFAAIPLLRGISEAYPDLHSCWSALGEHSQVVKALMLEFMAWINGIIHKFRDNHVLLYVAGVASKADSWESKALSHQVPPHLPVWPVYRCLLPCMPYKEDENCFYLMVTFKWP